MSWARCDVAVRQLHLGHRSEHNTDANVGSPLEDGRALAILATVFSSACPGTVVKIFAHGELVPTHLQEGKADLVKHRLRHKSNTKTLRRRLWESGAKFRSVCNLTQSLITTAGKYTLMVASLMLLLDIACVVLIVDVVRSCRPLVTLSHSSFPDRTKMQKWPQVAFTLGRRARACNAWWPTFASMLGHGRKITWPRIPLVPSQLKTS